MGSIGAHAPRFLGTVDERLVAFVLEIAYWHLAQINALANPSPEQLAAKRRLGFALELIERVRRG